MFGILTGLLLIFSFTPALAQSPESQADSIMKIRNIPEMTFAVVTKDRVLVKGTLGYHKVTDVTELPNARPDDLFHLGSNTKAITGFVAATLVEKGKINWDTRFFELFPNLVNHSNRNYHHVTLEDLLSHSARIQPFTSGAEYQKLPDFKGNKKARRKKFAKHVLTLPVVEKNKAFCYSNAGYSVAAVMLEKVSGKSWEKLVADIVRKKLRLDFAFGWPNRNGDNQPYGHWEEKGKLVPVSPKTNYDLSLAEPAGDISMNIENYARFIQMNIEGLAGHNNYLKSETYQYLHSSKSEYAIGWVNYTKNGVQISEHTGSDGTFFSYVQIDRTNLIGYIVIVNSGTASAQEGVHAMMNILKKNYKQETGDYQDKESILK